ncbi:MAG: DUF4296 domain-containing protein [Jejuia sp.]
MLKNLILIFCVCSVLGSCYQYNTPKKPERLLSKEEMFHVLLDLKLIAEAKGKDKRVLDSAHITSYRYIQKKYGIDSVQFKENNAYYSYYLEDYKEIFTKVKDSFSKLKEHYTAALEEERIAKKKRDSLKSLEKGLNKWELNKELDEELESELIEAISDND